MPRKTQEISPNQGCLDAGCVELIEIIKQAEVAESYNDHGATQEHLDFVDACLMSRTCTILGSTACQLKEAGVTLQSQ